MRKLVLIEKLSRSFGYPIFDASFYLIFSRIPNYIKLQENVFYVEPQALKPKGPMQL